MCIPHVSVGEFLITDVTKNRHDETSLFNDVSTCDGRQSALAPPFFFADSNLDHDRPLSIDYNQFGCSKTDILLIVLSSLSLLAHKLIYKLRYISSLKYLEFRFFPLELSEKTSH